VEWYYDVFKVLSLLVVWAIPAILVAAIVGFTVLAPTLALAGMGINLYKTVSVRLGSKVSAKTQRTNLVCSTNADCPPGLVCVNGRCVPVKPRVPS